MSATALGTRIGRELSAICGAEHVVEAPPDRILDCAATVGVKPGSPDEIAAVLRFANDNNLVLVPAGGLTSQGMGKAPSHIDILLNTTRLAEVEHYDPGDLTIGIGAGCTVAQLATKVGRDHLLFAGDPPLPDRATIGGLLATGISGPLRHGYGGLRDYCIGIKFVTGDGRVGKGGGRVVKNVAGYDMMKLLIGSWGTVAVITSASFKLFPAPRQTRTFVACFSSAVEAIEFRGRVLRSPLDPVCLELVSPEAHKLLMPGSPVATSWLVCVRVAGSDPVLARYRTELGSSIAHERQGDDEAGFWRSVANFAPLARERDPDSLLISVAAPLRDVRRVLDVMQEVSAANGFTLAAIGRVGVGHILAALMPAVGRQLTKENYIATVGAMNELLPHDASMAVLHCPAEARGEFAVLRTPTDLGSMRVVKQALDPKDILNRGRFLF